MAIEQDRQLAPPYQLLVGESARAFFEEIIQPDWRIFEWGLGPGSLWFGAQAAEVVSIENVTEWYNYMCLVRGQLYRRNLTIVFMSGCKNTPGWRDALDDYVGAIDYYPDNYFDLVFSDGWAESRALCPVRAMAKVRPGGWLVVDDVNWNPARAGAEPLVKAGWRQVRKSGVIGPEKTWDEHGRKTTTAFFQRPEGLQ